MTNALEAALKQRKDLDQYKAAKRTLFALQLTLELEDIQSVAATAMTDGPDDKSCDLLYVDRDSRSVILAQGYEATAINQRQAPAGKASSLHQAVNWLFGAQRETDVPQRLRSGWKELHEALAEGAIDDIEIWFVHNLPESAQVSEELDAAAQAAYGLVSSRYSSHQITVKATELGRETLADRYEGSRTPILVTDDFTIPVQGSFSQQGTTGLRCAPAFLRPGFTSSSPSIVTACSRPMFAATSGVRGRRAISTTESRRPLGARPGSSGRTTTGSRPLSTDSRRTSRRTL